MNNVTVVPSKDVWEVLEENLYPISEAVKEVAESIRSCGQWQFDDDVSPGYISCKLGALNFRVSADGYTVDEPWMNYRENMLISKAVQKVYDTLLKNKRAVVIADSREKFLSTWEKSK